MIVPGIIWDLDNTLYRFTDAMKYQCNVAAAKAAQDLGLSLPYEELLDIAIRSEKEYGYSLHNYILHHGLTYKDLHHPFHEAIDETLVEKIEGLKDFLTTVEFPKVILTNASRDWANRVLSYIGLSSVFQQNEILAMEDFHYEPKARTDRGLTMAIERLGVAENHILFIDDLERNLLIPYQSGLKTVLVHNRFDAEHILYQLDCPTQIHETQLLR